MNYPFISIIVPVYNVENYLEECVDSLLSQDYKEYEILLIDDGSTDQSGSICDKYSDEFDFIKTIHKENGGLSDARNVGIKYAKGDYLLFVDSDDFIASNSLGPLIETLRESPEVDLVFLNALKYYKNGKMIPLGDGYIKSKIHNRTQSEVLQHIASRPKYPGSACTKLVKRSLITEHQLYFEKGKTSEDLDWTMQLILLADQYNYCESNYYYYRQERKGSIGYSISYDKVYYLFCIINKWSDQAKEQAEKSVLPEFIYSCAAYEYMILLSAYGRLKHKEKAVLKKKIASLSRVLKYRNTYQTRIVSRCLHFFGIDITSFLLNIYMKFR